MQYCDGTHWIELGGPRIPTSGLVGYWKMDEGTGTTTTNSSGSGHTGALTNNPVWSTGHDSNSLSFNRTNQYVDVPEAPSLDLSGSWTVSSWVNLNTLPTSGHTQFVLGKGASGGQLNYKLFVDNQNYATGLSWMCRFQPYGYAGLVISYPASINTGVLYHFADVYDSVAQTETMISAPSRF